MTVVKKEALGYRHLLASFERGCSLSDVGRKALYLVICFCGLELSVRILEACLEAVRELSSGARTVRSVALLPRQARSRHHGR